MNQPEKPVPARSARPQLFKAPTDYKPRTRNANARHHDDFGPSILATIDGGQGRFAARRSGLPMRRVLLVVLLALVAVAVYLGVKGRVSASRAAASPEAPMAVTPVTLPAVIAKPADAAVNQGAAAIETVTTAAALAPASAVGGSSNVVASLSSIQLALDRPEAAPAKKEKATDTAAQPAHAAVTPVAAVKPATKPAAQADTDADLLAAMLPHLKRGVVSPTSPDYEKRCGQLSGDAAVDCRAKFCNGRQGVDAACPVSTQKQPG